MKRLPCALFLILFVAAVSAAAPEVEITSEPSHHLALENEAVRVFKVEVAPHASTLMHRHRHDYLFVTIGDAHVSNEPDGKPAVELKLADGETRFSPGNFAHIARNLADTPFRNVTIEILQDEKLRTAPSVWKEEGAEQTFAVRHAKTLFVKDGVRAVETTLDAGAAIPSHHHDHPHLLVAISDFELRTDVEGKGSTTTKYKPGDITWIEGGVTHTVTNLGKGEARFIAVNFP
jgi:quercetin dioxygenase-like cupin family protein